MRILAITVLSLTLAAGSALAQQAGTGGTCSGHLAACNQVCASKRGRDCQATCNNKMNDCMRSGTWESNNGTFSNVARQ
jgi:hypothetical protein